jgi:hypothetical protein
MIQEQPANFLENNAERGGKGGKEKEEKKGRRLEE